MKLIRRKTLKTNAVEPLPVEKPEKSKANKFVFTIGKAIDPGIKRKGRPNQDAIGVMLPKFLNRKPPLLIVADGMGGFQEGAKAAQIVINEIIRQYKWSRKNKNHLAKILKGIQKAHKKIRRYVKKNKEISSMGTTVAAAVVERDKAYIVNVGDSRIYLINESEIRQISFDHSLVAEQVRQGIIKPEEAHNHPRKNVLMLSISSKHEKLEPFTAEVDLKDGDTLLLCSDGLWGTVSDTQIQDVLLELPPQEAADKLVSMANMNQGPDNISVLVCAIN